MAFDDLALSTTKRAHRLVGSEGITFYPVRAAEVAAYLAAGNSGVENIRGVMDFLPVETETGDVAVGIERVTLDTDDTTIADNSIANGTAIEFKGIRYDVYRVLPDGNGAARLWLRRYDG